ncbi:hypothetical protein BaRGS_00040378 [Batillaria attramentaria]|uniref:Uncharacterized protein n=1 Tax=Batillaria attramentaria TaxID=370345 RepID=A0ABD0J123_9CAEN
MALRAHLWWGRFPPSHCVISLYGILAPRSCHLSSAGASLVRRRASARGLDHFAHARHVQKGEGGAWGRRKGGRGGREAATVREPINVHVIDFAHFPPQSRLLSTEKSPGSAMADV